ncbi:MAG: PAS domain S-box protein [Pseudomonadota bacterium]|nr:PAS domain S-box protein [Pseudomonadota bacterium]
MADSADKLQFDSDIARLIIESATDFAIISSDTHGILTSWSPGACKLLGWTADEAIGQHVELFFTSEDRQSGRPETEMALAREEGFASDERWHLRKDGSRFWASGELQPIRSDRSDCENITGYLKIVRDRTDHRLLVQQAEDAKAAAAAAAAEVLGETERLRALFEAAPGFIAVLRGRDLVFELANESYRRLVGSRDLIGRPARDALPEIVGQGFLELIDSVYAGGKAVTGHAQPVMLDSPASGKSERRFVDYVFQPIRDSAGTVSGVFLEGFDVTEAVLARTARDTAAAFQSAVLNQLGEGVIVTDAGGRIQFVNEAATRLHGVAELGVPPADYTDTYHLLTESGDPYPTDDLPLSRAVRGDTVIGERWRIRRPDGSEVLAIGNAQPVVADGKQIGAVLTVRDDTARRIAEAALAANEERFRELADNIPTLCWSARADGSIYWFNRRWYDYTGTTPASQEGWGWESVQHPDFLEPVIDAWKRAIVDGASFEMTFPLRGANGEYRRFLTRVDPIRDDRGHVLRWFGTNADVEEQTAAEEALSASRAYLKLLLDSADEAFYATDGEGVTTLCNAAFLRLTGFESEADAVGRKLHDLIHHSRPDGSPYPKELCPIYQCATHGKTAHVKDELFFRVDGTPFPVEYRASPILSNGQPDGAICTFNDVSERSAAEAALLESEERFKRIADSTPVAMWVTALDRTRSFVNQAYVEFLGISYEQSIEFDWRQIIHPDDVDRIVAASIAGEASLKPFVLEGRYRGGDGNYCWMRSISQPRFGPDGAPSGFIGVAHDVTYAKEAEDALRELNETLAVRIDEAMAERDKIEEQLRQSQKMEAVGQLTGGIAHDFNNLLTIVSGNIDMARRSLGVDADPRVARAIANAIKGADRAAALTQRLLAFSRRQPLQPRAIDINRVLAGMSELLDRALGETIDLQVVAGAGIWRVEVDPNQLENAILNLAVNARDAMVNGGKLTIETSNAHIDEAYAASQREVLPGQYVQVSITDTGAGMSADVIAKAFDPFFSTKDVGKGTGLGLSQVYGYVKQSGGHVKIYSEIGEGTTIKLYFPRLIADLKSAEDEEPASTSALEGQETILVVEDDDDVRMLTVESLRELGYRVLEAHDGPSALRLLERQEEPVRLLFTDVVMPVMSGRELADIAKAAYPDLQILFTTGYARNAIVHAGRLDAGVELLTKPFTHEALSNKVLEVLDKPGAHRALLIFPSADGRAGANALLCELGFDTEVAGSAREALGKLRSAGGRFDFVLLSDALPVGNLGAVIAELHAVRIDLPIVIIHSTDVRELKAQMAGKPCVGFVSSSCDVNIVRVELEKLRVRCADS